MTSTEDFSTADPRVDGDRDNREKQKFTKLEDKRRKFSEPKWWVIKTDGGYGWVIVFATFIANFFLLGMNRSFGVLFIEILRKFNQSATESATVSATYNGFRMLLGPVVTQFCKKYSCRKSMIFGGIGICVGSVAGAFATQLWHLTVSYGVICGASAAFAFTPPFIIVGQYFDKKKGKAMALGTVGAGFGSIIMGPLIVVLLQKYTYFGAMLILGALQLHHCVVGALYRPFRKSLTNGDTEYFVGSEDDLRVYNKNKTKFSTSSLHSVSVEEEIQAYDGVPNQDPLDDFETKVDKLNEVNVSSHSNQSSDKREEKESQPFKKISKSIQNKFRLFKTRSMWCYLLTISVMSPCLGMIMWYIADNSKLYGASDTEAAALTSLVGATDVVGRLAWGPIFDMQYFQKRRRMLHSILGILIGAIVVITGLQTTYRGLFIWCGIFGVIEGGYHSQRVTIISEIIDESLQPDTVGISVFFQGIGNMYGPFLGGLSKDLFGSYSPSYYLTGCMQCAACSVFLIDYIFRDHNFQLQHCKKNTNAD